jgi:HEAT repeat protein
MEVSMAISVGQLQGLLNVDEPDYNSLARLGPSVLPHLEQLVASRDEYIAANATSLAGMIGGVRAIAVLERAARSPSPLVRVAAAAAVGRVESPRASALLATLLSDRDKGVRKFAIKASARKKSAALAARIADLSRRDPMPHLRSLATQVRSRMRGLR